MAIPTNSLFEAIQNAAFATTEAVFGFPASWTPSTGGAAKEATVLFQNPTEQMKLAGVDYDPDAWRMEYRFGEFPGLKELSDGRSSNEVVVISGSEYFVAKIDTKFDGKTLIATLIPKP
jgi:hypothetical protein